VALIIKIHFEAFSPCDVETNTSAAAAGGSIVKKRKLLEPKRNETITDYSQIKLPALMFAEYLQSDSQHFINSCLR